MSAGFIQGFLDASKSPANIEGHPKFLSRGGGSVQDLLKVFVFESTIKRPVLECVKAIHHSGDEHFHFGLNNAGNLVPRDLPAIGINNFDIRIIVGVRGRGDAGMKFFQVATAHAGSNHDFGKIAL